MTVPVSLQPPHLNPVCLSNLSDLKNVLCQCWVIKVLCDSVCRDTPCIVSCRARGLHFEHVSLDYITPSNVACIVSPDFFMNPCMNS